MKKYCVIDLEATCWKRGDPNRAPAEIIEIGAVLLDENYNYISEFDYFVRPIYNPTLTEYCTDLTSIKQADINSALKLPAVITFLKDWLGTTEDVIFCSWGYFDKKQLLRECTDHMIDYPFDDNHINIKVRFSEIMRRTKKMSLRKALKILDLQFEGVQHRAIFDAKMTAEVFKIIMNKNK